MAIAARDPVRALGGYPFPPIDGPPRLRAIRLTALSFDKTAMGEDPPSPDECRLSSGHAEASKVAREWYARVRPRRDVEASAPRTVASSTTSTLASVQEQPLPRYRPRLSRGHRRHPPAVAQPGRPPGLRAPRLPRSPARARLDPGGSHGGGHALGAAELAGRDPGHGSGSSSFGVATRAAGCRSPWEPGSGRSCLACGTVLRCGPAAGPRGDSNDRAGKGRLCTLETIPTRTRR